MELIDLFNGDYLIDRLSNAYQLYTEDNYSDYPGRQMRFKKFVEKVLETVMKGDEHAFSLLIPDNQYIYEDLIETFSGLKSFQPEREGYYYYVTYIGSLNLICIEREPILFEE